MAPRPPRPTVRIAPIDVDPRLLAELDARVANERDAHPGSRVTRADLIRTYIERGLRADVRAPRGRRGGAR